MRGLFTCNSEHAMTAGKHRVFDRGNLLIAAHAMSRAGIWPCGDNSARGRQLTEPQVHFAQDSSHLRRASGH